MTNRVTLYSTTTCPWCAKTRELFKANNIKYKDIDVGSDAKAAQEMIKKSGQMGVPVIEINKQMVIGYDEPKIRKLLGLK